MERKFKIQQVEGKTPKEKKGYDCEAATFLEAIGFESRMPSDSLASPIYTGAIPKKGREFYVYYESVLFESERFGGKFRLVRKNGEIEETIDEGSADGLHYHRSLGLLTFRGKGRKLENWQFYCER